VLSVLSPVPVHGAATNVAQLAGGKGEFVLSLRSDGTVWGWGWENFGLRATASRGSATFRYPPQ
jgi:alpha-tubulin suppressor-like RCC1 family protein